MRAALISGAVALALICVAVVLAAGMVVPTFVIDPRLTEYEGAKLDAALGAVSEIGQRRPDLRVGRLGTSRVSTFRVTSVEKCPAGSPRAYSVEVDFYTVFGILLGKVGVGCGRQRT